MNAIRHLRRVAFGLTLLVAAVASAADDNPGLKSLDKATETKLGAQSMADFEQVIKLCKEALEAGLDKENTKFANDLLSSTLTQRAEVICTELFERPVAPNRVGRLVQQAVSDLEQSLEINPDQGDAQLLAAKLYAQLGQREKAMKALDGAVQASDRDPMAKAKALLLRSALQTDAALQQADINEAIRLQPNDPSMLRERGLYHLRDGAYKSAIEDFKASLAADPKDADTHEALGRAQSLMEHYDEAIESFNKAYELDPTSAGALVQRARVRAMKGDAKAAMDDVDEALKIQPGSVLAHELRAMLLGSAGKFDEALAEMGLLLRAMPNDPDLLLQLALLCQQAKQPEKALAAFDKTLQIDPRNATAFRGRADVYLSLGRQSEAINDYEAALKVEPKDSGVLNNLAWVLCTSPEERLRDGKRAIDLATQACEVTDYKAAHILSTLAAAYAETGDFDTAIKWSAKAVELGPPGLKGQLAKELESYQRREPWREASPPTDDEPAVDPAVKSSEPAENGEAAQTKE